MFSMVSLSPAASWPWDDFLGGSEESTDDKAWENEKPAKKENKRLRGTSGKHAHSEDTGKALSELKTEEISRPKKATSETDSTGIVSIKLSSQLQTAAKTHQRDESKKAAPMWQDAAWQKAMAEEMFGEDYYDNMAEAYGNSLAAMGAPLPKPVVAPTANTLMNQ